MCDSRKRYAYDFEVYLGAMGGFPESGLGEKILCHSIQSTSHRIYMDNYFTSPSLACPPPEADIPYWITFMMVRFGRIIKLIMLATLTI